MKYHCLATKISLEQFLFTFLICHALIVKNSSLNLHQIFFFFDSFIFISKMVQHTDNLRIWPLRKQLALFLTLKRSQRDIWLAVVMKPIDIFWFCFRHRLRYVKQYYTHFTNFEWFFFRWRDVKKIFVWVFFTEIFPKMRLFRKWSLIFQLKKKSGILQVFCHYLIFFPKFFMIKHQKILGFDQKALHSHE